MRAEWLKPDDMTHILAALTPENRLALEVSMATGLRINDVLALKPDQIVKKRFTVREEKTGKTRTIRLPEKLVERCIACSGQHYVFEHRTDGRKHRTRQAVFKDLRRVADLFRIRAHVSPHSARKVFAVEEYKRLGCDLKRVQKLLNHSSEAVTYLYAMADVLTERNKQYKSLKRYGKNGKKK